MYCSIFKVVLSYLVVACNAMYAMAGCLQATQIIQDTDIYIYIYIYVYIYIYIYSLLHHFIPIFSQTYPQHIHLNIPYDNDQYVHIKTWLKTHSVSAHPTHVLLSP